MRRLLTEVMSDYFESEDETEFSPFKGLTIRKQMPVTPKKASRWERIASPNRLHASYEFKTQSEYTLFLAEILGYERETGHRAKLVCDYPSVTIEVYTRDVNEITEIDLEYAKAADDIYKDVKEYADSTEKSAF